MIVKCQHSLETTAEKPQMLFYNWNRTWSWEGDVTEYWANAFALKGPKFFAKVKLAKFGLPPAFVRHERSRNW